MNPLNGAINRIIKYVKEHHSRPLYVNYNGKKVDLDKFLKSPELVDAKKRYDNFLKTNKRYPELLKINNVNYNKEDYSILYNLPVVSSNISDDDVFNYFVKKFGKVGTIDEVLTKINNRGYGHYFNNKLSNKQVIDQLKKGNSSINCTDISQTLYHIAKALGYEVKIIHVKCKGGDGHIRMDLRHKKHTGGNWIHRDGACVISKNGKPIQSIWCADGTLIATNPSWFKETVNY